VRKSRIKGERKGDRSDQSSEHLRHGNNCSALLVPSSSYYIISQSWVNIRFYFQSWINS